MNVKFQNKYRNASSRARWWDYGWNGAYFITICTNERAHHFGDIENGRMVLSHTGVIVAILWNEIPKHHQFVELGDFVIMPNHIHGILIIDKPINENMNDCSTFHVDNGINHVGSGHVGTGHALSLRHEQQRHEQQRHEQQRHEQQRHEQQRHELNYTPLNTPSSNSLNNGPTPGSQRFQNIGKNTLSSVIGSYKSAVTKYANLLGYPNGWQRLFHDHIIRNDIEYQKISDYIILNPVNWDNDKFRNP